MKKLEKIEDSGHMRNKEKKVFTLMMIPHWDAKPRRFSLRPATIFACTGFLVFLLVILSFLSTYLYNRSENYRNAYIESERAYVLLKEDYKLQDQELIRLHEYTRLVENEVRGLADLQKEVLDLVGLDPREYASIEVAHQPVTRSGGPAVLGFRSNDDFSPIGNPTESLLDALILEQRKRMESLIPDLEGQLDYLEAQPNILPAEGRISSPFGYRRHPITGRMHHHDGIDIANSFNTPIYSSGSGVVAFSGYQPGYGRMVIIQHGYGYESLYAHNQRNVVSQGEHVEKNQLIAYVGSSGSSTGPHVHFEVHRYGNPIDPLSLINDGNE